jgi:hypothetical protein
MTAKPYLAKYEVRHAQDAKYEAVYDPNAMVLILNGQPAILDPHFDEQGQTSYTKVQRETQDDQ